jgi:hypothetical protein
LLEGVSNAMRPADTATKLIARTKRVVCVHLRGRYRMIIAHPMIGMFVASIVTAERLTLMLLMVWNQNATDRLVSHVPTFAGIGLTKI